MSTDLRPGVQQQLDGIVKNIVSTYRIAIFLGFASIFAGFIIALANGDDISDELGNISSIVNNLKEFQAEGFFGLGIGIILLAPIVMLLRALFGFLAINDRRFVLLTGVVAAILVASTISRSLTSNSQGMVNTMRVSTVIIVAMESERKHLDVLMPNWEAVPNTLWPTWRNGDVVSVTCGIGMVAASAATQYAISTFQPTAVLNFGCTGAHVADLQTGDVVIGDRLVNQGLMRFAPDGSIIPLTIGFHVPGEPETVTQLATDRALLSLAQTVTQDVALPPWPPTNGQQEISALPSVRTGTVSSGDVWKQDPHLIHATHELTGSLCEDMEAASIAQICAMHKVPFLTVKDISNNELQRSTTFEGSTSELHSDELGLRAAMVIVQVIRALRATTEHSYS